MALNREQKRQLKRAGDLDVDANGGDAGNGNGNSNDSGADDEGSPRKGRATPVAKTEHKDERTSPRQFVREVRSELRKVAWPTRSETINYSLVALTLVFMTTLIFGLDWVFSEVVLRIFDAK